MARNTHRPRKPRPQRGGPKGPTARPCFEALEERCLLDGALFREIDGTGNNTAHDEWGSAGVALLRTAPAAYADGIDDPVVGSPARPSPRAVSNAVVTITPIASRGRITNALETLANTRETRGERGCQNDNI